MELSLKSSIFKSMSMMARTLYAAPSALKDWHPLSVRRFATAIKRMQRTVRLVSKLTDALPRIRSAVSLCNN